MPEPRDMRDVYGELRSRLEKEIPNANLTPGQKELTKRVLEFGYTAAFVERTCDMHEHFGQAEIYRREYEEIRKLLK
ncbi:MAG: hypothetical protein AABW56_04440 [Nanoarchaeota archaeon]